MSDRIDGPGPWLQFAIVSAIFFHITGSTFMSLGVVLPYMIEDLAWTWDEAGAGFTIFAFMVGIAGALPAWTLKRFGVKATYGFGGGLMAVGFGLFAMMSSLTLYFIAAVIMGIGFALCATVPGVHVLSNWMPERRSFAIGLYYTFGGLGGVAGPQIVNGIVALAGSWRVHWWVMAVSILTLCLAAMPFLQGRPERSNDDRSATGPTVDKGSVRVFRTDNDWRFRDAVRTLQYAVIVAAMTVTLLVGLTVNFAAVGHMMSLGVPQSFAAGALSAHAAVNALSRALGGTLATRIDPKWLLVAALVAEIVGSLTLAVADNSLFIALFAFGEGFGYGMCFFATTMLLVNYFGPKDNPALLGTMHTITTVAMIGPVLAGYVRESLGSFAYVFQGYALVLVLMMVIVAVMRPPGHEAQRLAKAGQVD